jgi:hypothetical protein
VKSDRRQILFVSLRLMPMPPSIEGALSWPMDSSARAPLLLLGKPEPAVSLRKKYFFELRETGFFGELETSRSALSGLLSGRVVRHG